MDATESDVDALRTSNRLMVTDLRQPQGFGEVYQIPKDAPSRYAGWFARVDGAVIAIFPLSQYVETRRGIKPLVPNSTEYFIGSVPGDRPLGGATAASRDRIDTSVVTGIAAVTLSGAMPSGRVRPDRVEPGTPGAKAEATATEPVNGAPVDAASAAAAAEAARLARISERVSQLFTDDARRDERVGRLLHRALKVDAPVAPTRQASAGRPSR